MINIIIMTVPSRQAPVLSITLLRVSIIIRTPTQICKYFYSNIVGTGPVRVRVRVRINTSLSVSFFSGDERNTLSINGYINGRLRLQPSFVSIIVYTVDDIAIT